MNIEKRIDKLEERLGVDQEKKVETLDDMLENLKRGEYGGEFNLCSFVVAARQAKEQGRFDVFLDGLRKRFPPLLADFFKDMFTRAMKADKR